MRKALYMLAGLLVAGSAMAMPSAGDLAIFDFTSTKEDEVVVGTFQRQLIAYHSDTDAFEERVSVVANGQSFSSAGQLPAKDLLTDAMLEQILSQCSAIGGSNETITVPAGTFQTCAMNSNSENGSGMVWLGAASFGLVKSDFTSNDGYRTILELRDYRYGN